MSKRIRIERQFVKEGGSAQYPDGARVIGAQWMSYRDVSTGDLLAGYEVTYEVTEADDNAR